MRNAFTRYFNLAAVDNRGGAADGTSATRFDEFKSRFPDRFYNCGGRRSDMSVAAGLRWSGPASGRVHIVLFAMRGASQQIRVDICYHRVCLW